jgi:hypothetical protein
MQRWSRSEKLGFFRTMAAARALPVPSPSASAPDLPRALRTIGPTIWTCVLTGNLLNFWLLDSGFKQAATSSWHIQTITGRQKPESVIVEEHISALRTGTSGISD